MSNILVEEGYPSNFHLGLSIFFWLILIFLALYLGIILIIKVRKTQLINRKELYISYIIICFGVAAAFIVIQLGVFFLNFLKLSISLALLISMVGSTFFIYYWEKNLINLKRIPTLWNIIAVVISVIDVIFIVVLGIHLFENLIFTLTLFFAIIGEIFLFYLLIRFTKRVEGDLRLSGLLMIFGEIIIYIGVLLDHPPLVSISPNILSIITPVLLMVSLVLLYFGIIGICDGLTSYYNQEQICTIHRGQITKSEKIYICPKCNTAYCLNCYEQVVISDGCWNCGNKGKLKPDKKEEEELEECEIDIGTDRHIDNLKTKNTQPNKNKN